MNPEFKPTDEFQDLLVALVDGELSDDERAKLNELIASDEDAREYYVQYMSTHAMLNWRHGKVAALDVPVALDAEPIRRPRNVLSWVVSLSVAAILVAGAAWVVWKQAIHIPPVATVIEGPEGDDTLAMGQDLTAGDYEIETGVRQLRLSSGVVIAMQGPVRLSLADERNSTLHQGSIRVYVPATAHGYIVNAANVEVLDLGTEFGVWTDKGEMEVHVFDGKVRLNKSVTATAGQAVHVGPGKGSRKIYDVKFARKFPAVTR